MAWASLHSIRPRNSSFGAFVTAPPTRRLNCPYVKTPQWPKLLASLVSEQGCFHCLAIFFTVQRKDFCNPSL